VADSTKQGRRRESEICHLIGRAGPCQAGEGGKEPAQRKGLVGWCYNHLKGRAVVSQQYNAMVARSTMCAMEKGKDGNELHHHALPHMAW